MNQIALNSAKHPLDAFAERFNIDPLEMENVLKATCFKQKENVHISNEQMVALMVIAEQYDLNPFLKQIYAFPDKSGGIVPVVGIDGWLKLINKHPQYDGMEIQYSDNWVSIDGHAKPCPEYMTCTIHRKDRKITTPIREDLDECYKPPFKKGDYVASGPWQTHPKRFLRHKTIIQAARVVFNITGIYDEDEAQSIIENREKEINPDFKGADYGCVKNYQEEGAASRTDEIVSHIEKKQSQPPINKAEGSSDHGHSDETETKKDEKESSTKPKKMTVKQKNDFIERITKSTTLQELNDLIPDVSQYEEKTTHMMELRAAWSEKTKKIKNENKNGQY